MNTKFEIGNIVKVVKLVGPLKDNLEWNCFIGKTGIIEKASDSRFTCVVRMHDNNAVHAFEPQELVLLKYKKPKWKTAWKD